MLIIGICGASGSGKTTLANQIVESIGQKHVGILSQDAYYRDRGHIKKLEDRFNYDFDHPQSIDFELFISHVQNLKSGLSIDQPIFLLSSLLRKKEVIKVKPKSFLIVEGHLIFSEPRLMNLINLKVFLDTPIDICLLRRVNRQLNAPRILLNYTVKNYQNKIRNSYKKNIEVYKCQSDIILYNKHDGFVELLKNSLTSMKILDSNTRFFQGTPAAKL